jgi:GNAT superfamily N-acetyltransferase
VDIRWDWLQPLITVPYVPALGPVHPDCLAADLFADVLTVAGTGRFLPYDKDRRWSDHKDEHVIGGNIVQQPGLVLIPAFSARRKRLRVHVYSQTPHSATVQAVQLAERLSHEHRAATGQVTWFLPPGSEPGPGAACTRIYMRTFEPDHPAPVPGPAVIPLDDVPGPDRASFGAFAGRMAGDGFAFLHTRLRQQATGPLLTVQRAGKVAGAIGPLETGTDSQGLPVLLPQYFGVLPEYRGLGLGRHLWRAAMHWGQQHHARYQLLQAQADSPADSLYRSEGLTDLGLICTSTT